jgi:GH15 family glucan-1,4-alpha-glucosidase
MDKTITVDQLATVDLGPINEIWLGGTHTQLCLWRGEQIFTHEMLSEGTHDQNVQRLCLQLVNPDDQAAVVSVERIARERLKETGKEGEFYPAEKADTHQ